MRVTINVYSTHCNFSIEVESETRVSFDTAQNYVNSIFKSSFCIVSNIRYSISEGYTNPRYIAFIQSKRITE